MISLLGLRRTGAFGLVAALSAACGGSGAAGASPPLDGSVDGAPSLDAGTSEGGLPVWPAEWSADIRWSDFASDGTKTNTWTGHVSYSWAQRSMRTDVVPPADGGTAGPPIGAAGSMLMKNGRIYFIPTSGACTLTAAFGAPRPDWLSASGAVPVAGGSTASDERVAVDLARFDAGVQGCFNYLFDRGSHTPLLFGGSSSCDSWPQGSYIEYVNFSTQPVSTTLFEVPAGCALDAASPAGATGCTSCHEAP
jgi:hypothetical protein